MKKGRKLILSITSLLLILSLSLLLLDHAYSLLLEKNNLKSLIEKNIGVAVGNDTLKEMEDRFIFLKEVCKGKEKIEVSEFIKNMNITINCSLVENSTSFKELLSNTFLSSIYYKHYKCNVLECLKKGNLLYFVSYDFYTKLIYWENILLGISFFLCILAIAFSNKISGKLKTLGSVFLITGLPFFVVEKSKHFISILVQQKVASSVSFNFVPMFESVLSGLFYPIEFYYKLLIFSGVVLLGLGYVVEYFLEKRK